MLTILNNGLPAKYESALATCNSLLKKALLTVEVPSKFG
jgi:hypothetical protein